MFTNSGDIFAVGGTSMGSSRIPQTALQIKSENFAVIFFFFRTPCLLAIFRLPSFQGISSVLLINK
jgi:hypothetical protein